MFESFSVLVGVPGAIDASLNIIKKLRDKFKDGTKDHAAALDDFTKIESDLEEAKALLTDFAVSFDELDAWKNVHKICNELVNNFNRSFAHLAKATDRYKFERKIYNETVKDDLLNDIEGLYHAGQAGTLLKKYKTETKLHGYVLSLKDADDSGIEWHIRTEELIENINAAANEGRSQILYDSLKDLSRYINMCNFLADEAIIKGINEYNIVVKELKKVLAK